MCLSTVYDENRQILAKNVASVTQKDGKLVFTDILGIPVTVSGTVETVDLMDNFIVIKRA